MESQPEYKQQLISIHTPAWGVTRTTGMMSVRSSDFNPHPRVGGDVGSRAVMLVDPISIHTPAWGVTDALAEKGMRFEFQSTPPRGG